MSEQDIVKNQTEILVTDEPLTNPEVTDDAIQFVATGVWEDPRTTVTGRVSDRLDAKTNAAGKPQCSIRVISQDGNPILISAFDGKVKMLDGLKLGYTYTFKGKLKTKTEMYLGKERTSQFLNL
jgi:hypothetical protein